MLGIMHAYIIIHNIQLIGHNNNNKSTIGSPFQVSGRAQTRRPVGSLYSWMLPRLVRPVLWALTSSGCNSSPGDIWTIPGKVTNLRELCDVVFYLIKWCAKSSIPWTLSNTKDPQKLMSRFILRLLPFLPLRFKMINLYLLLFVFNKWYVLLIGSWCFSPENVECLDRVISPGNFG